MSYVFGLSFEYRRYKRDAVMKIFADDHLVREIDLTEDIKLKTVNLTDMPRDKPVRGHDLSLVSIIPEKLFLFDISGQYLHSNIRIEIHNDNNNYTNSFMTKYSYVKFHQIFLIPDYMLEPINWRIIERIQLRYGDDLIKKFFTPPVCPETGKATGGILLTHLRNNTHKVQSVEPYMRLLKLGGSFILDIPLQKKHKTVHLGLGHKGSHLPDMMVERLLWAFKQLNTNT